MSFSSDVKNEIRKNIKPASSKKSSKNENVKFILQEAFLEMGSVTDPEKGYHLEFVSSDENRLIKLQEIMEGLDIKAGVTIRKNQHVLYIKEGQAIVDLLGVMGAHVSLMNMENSIIMKDFRNGINRKVNCEAANLIKSANAGSRQVSDIEFIRDNKGIDKLPENLRQIAYVRLENPDVSLKELGELLDPPVGKSGVNHRLRKISEIADSMR